MAGLVDLYVLAFKKFADFSGRANRAEACAFLLTNTFINIIIYILLFMLIIVGFCAGLSNGGISSQSSQNAVTNISLIGFLVIFVLGAFYLITLIPTISLSARRLHDLNLSGWVQLIVYLSYFIPLLNLIVSFVFLIVMCCVKGTEGSNDYGEPSLEVYN